MICVSIIIPMYNAQSYIQTCLKSCINQTFRKFEIILIDDDSTDNSLEMSEKILKKSNIRYQIIKQEKNKGVAECRNEGMKHATGKYFFFLDADDVIDKNALQILYNIAENNQFLMVYCKHKRFVEEKEVYECRAEEIRYEKININYNELQERIYAGTIWGGLIQRTIIDENKLKFIRGLDYGEDTIFKSQCLYNVDFLIEVDCVLYWWRITPNSLSSFKNEKEFVKRELTLINFALDLIQHVERKPKWDGMMIRYIRAKKNALVDFGLRYGIEIEPVKKGISTSTLVNMEVSWKDKIVEIIYVILPFLETWKIQKLLIMVRNNLIKRRGKRYDS